MPSKSDRPIRVVMFGSGPRLNRDAAQFLARLEAHAEIEFLGAICQAEAQSLGAVVKDLWRRRGLLAVPLLIAQWVGGTRRLLAQSRTELTLRKRLARLSDRIRFVADIHAPEVLDLVRSLKADLGLVYGSPILRPELFNIPRLGSLGIHHGKVPEYRGNKTTFWAMYNGEPVAGVTIQKIDAGLDTGSIVKEGTVPAGRRSYPAVVRDLETLGLDLYLQAILEVKHGTATFRPQSGAKGKLYRNPKVGDFVTFWLHRSHRRFQKQAARTGGADRQAVTASDGTRDSDLRPRLSGEVPGPRRPLKICILTETYSPEVGGGETQARLLAEGLTARGHSVLILTRRSNSASKASERVGPVKIFRLPPAGSGHLKKWGLIFSSIPRLMRSSREYDLIFVSGFRIVGISAVVVSKLFHKRCILKADSQGEMSGAFFAHGLKKLGFAPDWRPFRVFLRLRNVLLRQADAFAAISSDTAAELRSAGIPTEKIHMVPNGVDTDRFLPIRPEGKSRLRAKLALPADAAIAVYTGRLVAYKGLLLLLRVWQEILKTHGKAALVLVGTGGLDIHNCEAELLAYVKTNGLGPYVFFTGSVPNVEEYLQAADLFALPTENDALPSSLIEAMACALPVVTTPVGAIGSIVIDRQNGLLVPPQDYHQLYQALDLLLSDNVLASRLGQEAWRTVHEHYSATEVTHKFLALFNQTVCPVR